MRLTSSPLRMICFLVVGLLPFAAAAQTAKSTAQFVTSSGQKLTRDPQTNQLVAVSGTQAAPQAAALARPAQSTPVTINGISGVLLDESTMSFAVATKGADGKASFHCVEGKDKATLPVTQTTAGKEKLDEK